MENNINIENENNVEDESKYIGSLFNSINYSKEDDLNKFIENLNPDQSLYCLIQAVGYAYSKGIFNIHESEVVSKSIRLITTPPSVSDEEMSNNG